MRFSQRGSLLSKGSGIVLALGCGAMGAWGQPPSPDFGEVVTPFVRDHCVRCHGPEKQKGRLRLDDLPNDFKDPAVVAKWTEVVNAVNAHEMPPEDEPQPPAAAAGAVASWLETALANGEIARRSAHVVLRRLNRAEYNNTIRDLVGVDFKPAEKFPEDPPAGGFDNIGQALTISPMQVELYYAAARQILDRALVEGTRPPVTKWRFQPEEDVQGSDRTRVAHDGQKILMNKGENRVENGFTIIHHEAWNTNVTVRDFAVPTAGDYIVRFRAAGRIPARAEVMASVRALQLEERDRFAVKDPKQKEAHQRRYEDQLQHFAKARTYQYGPPRVKITQSLGGTPLTIAEMDIPAPLAAPATYEVPVHFTTLRAGLVFDQAYEVTRSLENFTFLDKDRFARPLLYLDWIELEGPIHPTWPPASHRKILWASPNEGKDEAAYAREVLERFMTRAYRRPATPAEVDGKLALFSRIRAEKPSFVEAIKTPLAAVLASPHFLYLVEPEAAADGVRPLSAEELASRLSYFLWSSMPDDELFRAAAAGALATPANLRAQATRLLADAKSDAFVKNFTGQWLGLRKVGANPPAKTLYPEYDRHLETSIVRETEGFFAEILRHDLDARNLIKSEFVTINERLARFYGIDGVAGDSVRRVAAPPASHRGGLITQASIHSITSNGTRTSPVTRGVWVLKTLLGTDPGLPVANVGEIASQVPGIDKATVRQRLAIHREAAACARCHDKIDPLGLALENFNAAGEWRDREGHGYQGRIEADDPVIDAHAVMPDGTAFVGVDGLQAQLLGKEDLFFTALASQLYTYALGRELGFSDRAAVRAAVAAMKADGTTLRALILHIVSSASFTTK
jgi:hypothetical protein